MTESERLEFVTRHFRDLQSIRLAPLPVAIILLALMPTPTPHVGRIAAWSILLSFVFCVVGFYWWSTAAIRRRYGSVRTTREEELRMRQHPMIILLTIALGAAALWRWFSPGAFSWADVYLAFTVLGTMLIKILDVTNPASRRIAWGLGLLILSVACAFFVRSEDSAPFAVLAGMIWLAISVFDFMLLRRGLAGC